MESLEHSAYFTRQGLALPVGGDDAVYLGGGFYGEDLVVGV